jgi:hypothetical protein
LACKPKLSPTPTPLPWCHTVAGRTGSRSPDPRVDADGDIFKLAFNRRSGVAKSATWHGD